MLGKSFNLQGHRGARGVKPENTLPSFEAALDTGASSIETDLHLTLDNEVVLCHDPKIGDTLVRTLTRKHLSLLQLDANPDPARFPKQNATLTPLAELFAKKRGINPFGAPALDDLFGFVAAYAAEPGQSAGKSDQQRARAARLVFDLELKRVPGRPERIGDGFDGNHAALLESRVLECISRHGVLERTVVRSFDHRCVKAIKDREPRLRTAILIAGTAPVAPHELAKQAGASIYAPSADSLDQLQLQHSHKAGIAVIPWTVNDPADWDRFLAWGVDGIATDFPDRLADYLLRRGIPF